MTRAAENVDDRWKGFPYFLFGALVGGVLGQSYQMHKLTDAVERQSSFYLCIELWKLGESDAACDALLAARGGQP